MTSITLSPIPSAPIPGERGPWLQTNSGGRWYYLDPLPEDVVWNDIARALAMTVRFNGHTLVPYSVAQHCVEVAKIVGPDAQPYALLHDAQEAYLGDWPTPLKEALATYGKRPALRHLEDMSSLAIHRAAGLEFPPPPDIAAEVKHADQVLLVTEARDFHAHTVTFSRPMPRPMNRKIKPLTWTAAADAWLKDARLLLPRMG
ncbi:hypothetical protein [Elstera sp.]|jgi:hypothetical protein|uniref:hypothetical protein n=1 Tax=Elstera sp. TaxID=1916664 RepID=UPI0037BE87AE